MKRIIHVVLLSTFAWASSHFYSQSVGEQREFQQAVKRSLKNNDKMTAAAQGRISTFLTFQDNNAEEAMNFYVSLFEDSKINEIRRHGEDGPAKEGSILYATFELNGSKFACSDSYIKHEWDFTPGVSNFVECLTNDEIEELFAKLSDGGQVMMPIDNYGWSQKFAFVPRSIWRFVAIEFEVR